MAARRLRSTRGPERLLKAAKGVFGVRPEHFAVGGRMFRRPGPVRLVEPLGSDTLIHFELAGTQAIARVDP